MDAPYTHSPIVTRTMTLFHVAIFSLYYVPPLPSTISLYVRVCVHVCPCISRSHPFIESPPSSLAPAYGDETFRPLSLSIELARVVGSGTASFSPPFAVGGRGSTTHACTTLHQCFKWSWHRRPRPSKGTFGQRRD